MALEAIRYRRGSLQSLNQLRLPHEQVFDEIHSVQDAWHAIRDMRTRGAPAIAIVAALSLAVELDSQVVETRRCSLPTAVQLSIEQRLDYLVSSRPTAVNLADAVRKLKRTVEAAVAVPDASGTSVGDAYIEAAERMLVYDVSDNQSIGRHGSKWIMEHTEFGKTGIVSIVTHCNTGSLATAGYGTALGVIRSLHASGALMHAFCTETRPYNQGSRLTAFELFHDGIPAVLVSDSMAAALLRLKGGPERIAAIVVGADRVAANGDTANKIGTYSLAIIAKHHGVKFLVAAPRSTVDMQTKSGCDIVIEERPSNEMRLVRGPRFDGTTLDVRAVETVSIASHDVAVWNPAFDVTPAELIDGIVTEVGVMEKDSDGVFRMDTLFEQ